MKLTSQFLEKYNKTGPRYTSYPPATSFKNVFNKADYIQALIQSNSDDPKNISVYIHIPFCPQLCFFCGCNTSAFGSATKIRRYIDCILKEIDTVTGYLDKTRIITQIHWGGGTPNSINFDYLEEIIEKNLPLPRRDLIPETVEEQIIAFADKFYSKSKDIFKEKSLKEVRKSIAGFGQSNIDRFEDWCELFL